jgi:hypothetical protein
MGPFTRRSRWFCSSVLAVALIGLPGCGSDGAQSGTDTDQAGSGASPASGGSSGVGGSSSPPEPLDPGTVVSVTPNAEQSAEAERVEGELTALDGIDAAGIAERYPTAFEPAPSYDTSKVVGLDKIQASHLALNAEELTTLGSRGFVITDNRPFPSFAYGYSTIYLEDLPVYISTDSILDAVHRSYDDMLKFLEQDVLLAELDTLLGGMHGKLRSGPELATSNAVKDADVFIAVARSLLKGSAVVPVAGGDTKLAASLFDLAQAGKGVTDVTLFGVRRTDEDFSQFTPRGHYTDSPALTRYFKAMMWLGRIDLRILETQPNGDQLFRRRQLEGALLLSDLIGADLRGNFDNIDRTVEAFVGESDYLTVSQLDQLKEALNVASSAELGALSDEAIVQALVDGNFGAQRISSHIMVAGPHQGALPLSRSFALLGQRYVIDSHVFSNVVYDRVNGGGPKRMMPSPLDAAFAALGNEQAVELLSEQLSTYEQSGYPGALAQMRVLADEHPPEFWGSSLYSQWLGALRELSPNATSAAKARDTLFPAARSEAWGRRLLNTQLASWAQLRHDTILYAKQSYTGGATCDFPDGYVDPYPGFYAAIGAFAARGKELMASSSLSIPGNSPAQGINAYFEQLKSVAEQLQGIAEHQRSGAELTPEMLAFINEAVVVQSICGGGELESGWYKRLFFLSYSAVESDPTIADVHTQPTDEGGGYVGHVLHVGTGDPRLMVVVAEGCSGPRAYAGLASSYREKITDNFERLTDEQWQGTWFSAPEPSWMADLVSGSRSPSAE